MYKEIKGVTTPIITPFKSNYEIDEGALRSHIRYMMDKGVRGIIPCGSTGEYSLLTKEERKRVVEITLDEVGGKALVIPGTTAVRNEDAVEFTEHAKDKGADAVMVSPSYYFSTTEDELYQYYKDVAEVGIPIILYNVPCTVKVDMSPQFMVRLANDFENIKYVKEATGDICRIHELIRLSNEKLTVFSGWDILTLEAFAVGAKGWVAAPGNLLPRECVELYELAVEKSDLEKARELYYAMLPALMLIEGSGKFVQYVKAGVELLGGKAGSPRKPLLPISEDEKKELKKALDDLERRLKRSLRFASD